MLLRKRVLRKRACSVGLAGALRVKGAKPVRLKKRTVALLGAGTRTVKLSLTKKRLRALRRALDGRKRMRAVVKLTAGTDIALTRKLRLSA